MSEAPARLIPGMSFGDYCRLDAVNVSTLLHLADQTPQEAYYDITHGQDDTDSLVRGHAAHAAVLEPEVFARDYAATPSFGDYRSSANRTKRDEWIAANADKIILEPEQYAAAVAMRDALMGRPDIAELLTSPGQNELTVSWRDEPTGLACKGRVDRITKYFGWPTVIDLKTTRATSDRELEKHIAQYNYHVRFAWYVDALNAVKPAEWRSIIIWVKNTPPHVCRVTEFDDGPIEEGRAAYRHYLDLYAKCRASGNWPGHPPGVEPLNLPRWAYRFTSPTEV